MFGNGNFLPLYFSFERKKLSRIVSHFSILASRARTVAKSEFKRMRHSEKIENNVHQQFGSNQANFPATSSSNGVVIFNKVFNELTKKIWMM